MILMNMKMKWIGLIAIAGLWTACSQNKAQGDMPQPPAQDTLAQQDTTKNANTPAKDLGPLEQEHWQLTRMVIGSDVWKMIDSTQVTAVFDGARVSGNGGCNDYFGAYTADGASLHLDKLASSKKLCSGRMGQESSYFKILEGSTSYSMPDSLTLVVKSSGGELTFRALRNGEIQFVGKSGNGK